MNFYRLIGQSNGLKPSGGDVRRVGRNIWHDRVETRPHDPDISVVRLYHLDSRRAASVITIIVIIISTPSHIPTDVNIDAMLARDLGVPVSWWLTSPSNRGSVLKILHLYHLDSNKPDAVMYDPPRVYLTTDMILPRAINEENFTLKWKFRVTWLTFGACRLVQMENLDLAHRAVCRTVWDEGVIEWMKERERER